MTSKKVSQKVNLIKPEVLKEELDHWVKDFEKKIQRTSEKEVVIDEHTQNIEYNYELIKQQQKEIDELKKEIKQMKHYTYVALKSRPLREL